MILKNLKLEETEKSDVFYREKNLYKCEYCSHEFEYIAQRTSKDKNNISNAVICPRCTNWLKVWK